MLREKDEQRDFFEVGIEGMVPAGHQLMQIAGAIDFASVEAELKEAYSEKMGRPSYRPLVVLKMLLLEYLENLSDVGVCEECRYNLLYRAFVGLGLREEVPDDTTLVVFRKRMGEARFQKLFDGIIKQAQEKGLIGGRLKIVDATKIDANIEQYNAVNLLRQARRHLIRAVEKETGRKEEQLRSKYMDERRSPRKPEKEEINQEREKTGQLVREIAGKHEKAVEAKRALVEELLQMNEQEVPDIKSMVDPDARFGQTSPTKKFVGYKAFVSYDDESELITSCRLLPGNRGEGKKGELKKLIEEDEKKGIHHTAVVGDGAFDSKNNRQDCHDARMRAFISSRRPNRHLNDFNYNKDTKELVCPSGETTASHGQQEDGRMYFFSVKKCRGCSRQTSCPGTKNMERTRVYVSNDYLVKLEDQGEERTAALKRRKLIEKKFGEGKLWHGLRRARYWRKWRVSIQMYMIFLAINLKRIVKLLEKQKEKEKLAVQTG